MQIKSESRGSGYIFIDIERKGNMNYNFELIIQVERSHLGRKLRTLRAGHLGATGRYGDNTLKDRLFVGMSDGLYIGLSIFLKYCVHNQFGRVLGRR